MRLISLHGAGHAQQPEHTETGHRAAGQGQPGISRAAETEGPQSRQHPQRHEGDQRRHQGVLPRARWQPGDQSGGGGRQEEAGEDAGKRARPHHGVSAPGRCHAANAGSSIADSIQVHSIATRPAAKPSSAIHSHSDAAAATRPIWWPRRPARRRRGQRQLQNPSVDRPTVIIAGSPLVAQAGGDGTRVAVVAPGRAVAGRHVLPVGGVGGIDLQAPRAAVVMHAGIDEGERRRVPVVVDVAVDAAVVAHARTEAEPAQRAGGEGVVGAQRRAFLRHQRHLLAYRSGIGAAPDLGRPSSSAPRTRVWPCWIETRVCCGSTVSVLSCSIWYAAAVSSRRPPSGWYFTPASNCSPVVGTNARPA
ncbi:hypothetical protein G6F31_013343 [Rhizopus arrhizus]|nr:hypothetical protein G6F31_013343 [Rhizopus arrhizus]